MKEPSAIVNTLKVIISFFTTLVSGRFGVLPALLFFMMLCMIADWVTGIMAAVYLKRKNPGSSEYGYSSPKGMRGIFKKVAYLFAVGVGLGLDWLVMLTTEYFELPFKYNLTFFGGLVTVWYIVNELMSILENLDDMDAHVPAWMKKFILFIRKKVERQGDSAVGADDDGGNNSFGG